MQRTDTVKFTRWKRNRRYGAFLCALILLSGLIGCDGLLGTEPTPTAPPVETILPEEAPQEGGSFAIAMPEKPNSWNPLLTTSREMIDLYGLIYDGLVRFDDERRPIPGLALNWSLEEDGVTWTFVLREEAAFHDGKILTAKDVVKTLDLIKKYQKNDKISSPYEWIFNVIDSYAAEGDYTLKVKGKKAGYRVVYAMDFPVLPASYGGGETPPVGTSVYQLSQLEKGKNATLSANPDGWRKKPYISTIEVKAMPDTNTALTGLHMNMIGLIHTTSVMASAYKNGSGVQSVSVTTQNYECIIPNVNRASLGDKRMRQAILYALDRGTLLNEVYLGGGTLVDCTIPPDSFLHNPAQKTYEFNTAKARELLAELGYDDADEDGYVEKGGTTLTYRIIVNENPGFNARADAARLAVKQLKEVGIKANLSVLSSEEYRKALKNGNFDLAFCGFALTGDFDVSSILRAGGANYYGRYSSATLNNLLDAYAGAIEEKELVEKSQALQGFILEELPVISLYFQNNVLIYSGALKGIGRVRDTDLYRAVEQWYCYESGDDLKVGAKGE